MSTSFIPWTFMVSTLVAWLWRSSVWASGRRLWHWGLPLRRCVRPDRGQARCRALSSSSQGSAYDWTVALPKSGQKLARYVLLRLYPAPGICWVCPGQGYGLGPATVAETSRTLYPLPAGYLSPILTILPSRSCWPTADAEAVFSRDLLGLSKQAEAA